MCVDWVDVAVGLVDVAVCFVYLTVLSCGNPLNSSSTLNFEIGAESSIVFGERVVGLL